MVVRKAFLYVLIFALMLSLGTVCGAQTNVFPDPSFEKNGVVGEARTGKKAGQVTVGAESRWAPIPETQIKVEPFATYKITGYAKGSWDTGTLNALYTYSWNSYVWAYASYADVPKDKDWALYEATFYSPNDIVHCHPLAFWNASNAKALVDDVTVVKIKSPAETIKTLESKPQKSQEDIQILVRYYLTKNNVSKAETYMVNANTFTKSDIACFRAKNIKNNKERIPFILDMIKYEGMTYANAAERLIEVTSDFTITEKAALIEQIASKLQSGVSPATACAVLMRSVSDRSPYMYTMVQKTAFVAAANRMINAASKTYFDTTELRSKVEPDMKKIGLLSENFNEILHNPGTRQIYVKQKLITSQDYAVVVPDKPTIQEEFVAKDLVNQLEMIIGARLPVVAESKIGKKSGLYIGKTKLAQKAGVDFNKLGLEGIALKTWNENLIFAGNKRGVLYSVYSFMEDYLGCRWYTPDCSVIPNTGVVKLPMLNTVFIPKLEHRATDYPHSRDQDWAVKNKINGQQPNIDEQRGNCIRYQGFVHTFDALVPPSQYFAEHPEYFSEINGVRVGTRTQLCLTNPDVLKITIENVKKWYRDNPEATIVSVSQNDWGNYCQCANCAALAKEEGSQCGPLLHFINAIADAVKDEFPDKIVDTLAYQWSRKPPLHVKPRPNVVVRLCSIECCFTHPLETCSFNTTFVTDIQNWHKICNRLWMWDYVINYAHTIMPFPNLYSLQPNIDFFIRNGVTGIYEEADYYTKGGELAELRTWIMAKTLWDPTYNTDRAIDEFLNAYYGPAAKPIRSYVNLIHKQVLENPDLHMTIYYPPTAGHLTPDVIKTSNELFDQAENLVRNDEKLLHRVKVARLPIIYSMIELGYSGHILQDNKLVVPANRAEGGLVGAFEKTARAEGVTMISEGRTLDNWLQTLGKRGEDVDVVTLSSSSLKLDVLPNAGGRIWRMTYLPANKDIFRISGKPDSYQISEGGYEEYSDAKHRSAGWNESYSVSEQSQSSIKLNATLENGLTFTRIYNLDPEKPTLHITSTLTNNTSASIEGGIRVHPEFKMSDVYKSYIVLKTQGGSWDTISLSDVDNPDLEHEQYLRGDTIPDGEWAYIDATDGIGIVERFSQEPVDFAYYNWFGNAGRVNLELFPKLVMIKSGESVSFTHSYEIVPDAANILGVDITD